MQSARPLIVKRIIDANLGFNKVLGISNLAALTQQNFTAPACFVWRAAQRANPDSMDAQQLTQAVDVRYGLIIVTKLEKDTGTQNDQAEVFSDQVMTQLLGWSPFGSEEHGLIYVEGHAVPDLERNLLLWRDTYSLLQYISNPYS